MAHESAISAFAATVQAWLGRQASSAALPAARVAVVEVHSLSANPHHCPVAWAAYFHFRPSAMRLLSVEVLSFSIAARFSRLHLEPGFFQEGRRICKARQAAWSMLCLSGRPPQAGCNWQAKHAPKRATNRSSAPDLRAPHPNPMAHSLAKQPGLCPGLAGCCWPCNE